MDGDAVVPIAIYLEIMRLHAAAEEAQQQELQQADQQRQDIVARRPRRRRRFWVSPLLREERRFQQGWYHNLIQELEQDQLGRYRNFMRMTPDLFNEILTAIRPRIQRQDTRYRAAIPPELRLALTLRYLATGCSYLTLHYAFRVGVSTVASIVKDTCAAINEILMDRYIKMPANSDEWLAVAQAFSTKWNFEHTLGAVDGKHIRLRKPRSAGSKYFNYKGFHSIILLAVADANYKFLYIDVGKTGRSGDSGVYEASPLKEAINNKELPIPEPAALPHDRSGNTLPYFFVGDDAFALNESMMKPYRLGKQRGTWCQEVFNYRLSRARRIIENVFGILVHRFRCLITPLQQEPEVATEITMACCVLHNFLCVHKPDRINAMPGLVRYVIDVIT